MGFYGSSDSDVTPWNISFCGNLRQSPRFSYLRLYSIPYTEHCSLMGSLVSHSVRLCMRHTRAPKHTNIGVQPNRFITNRKCTFLSCGCCCRAVFGGFEDFDKRYEFMRLMLESLDRSVNRLQNQTARAFACECVCVIPASFPFQKGQLDAIDRHVDQIGLIARH